MAGKDSSCASTTIAIAVMDPIFKAELVVEHVLLHQSSLSALRSAMGYEIGSGCIADSERIDR